MWTKAKDQDFHYFFFGLANNDKTKRLLRSYVFENYDKVRETHLDRRDDLLVTSLRTLRSPQGSLGTRCTST